MPDTTTDLTDTSAADEAREHELDHLRSLHDQARLGIGGVVFEARDPETGLLRLYAGGIAAPHIAARIAELEDPQPADEPDPSWDERIAANRAEAEEKIPALRDAERTAAAELDAATARLEEAVADRPDVKAYVAYIRTLKAYDRARAPLTREQSIARHGEPGQASEAHPMPVDPLADVVTRVTERLRAGA